MTFLHREDATDGAYRHTQTAGTILILLGSPLLVCTIVLVSGIERAWLFGVVLVLALVILMTHSLTTTVNDEGVEIRLGTGIVRRAIPLDDVRRVALHRMSRPFRWGVTRYENGWLYSVAGAEAVRIELTGGAVVLVASDDSHGLLAALRTRLVQNAESDT